MNFGGVIEEVMTREEFPLEKAREILKNETIAVIGYGGEALNFAVHASKFEGINVILLGAVGQDPYAEFIMNSISDKKIDVSNVRVEKDKVTANNRTYLTKDGDRYYKEDSWTGDIVDKMILNQEEIEMVKDSDVVFIHFWAGCFSQIIELKKNNYFKLAVDI